MTDSDSAPSSDSLSDLKPRVFYEETSELVDEGSTSIWAVIALLLGLASCSAVASPILWVLPIITIFLSVAALRSIKSGGPKVRGRGLVVVALTSACFFGGLAPVRHITRQRELFGQARQQVESWLELVRKGELMKAHQLKLGFQERAPVDSELVEHYKESQKRMLYDRFVSSSPIAEIARWGERAQVRHVADLYIDSTSNDDAIVQRFDIGVEKDGQTLWMQTQVTTMRRSFRESRESRWELKDITVVSLPANLP